MLFVALLQLVLDMMLAAALKTRGSVHGMTDPYPMFAFTLLQVAVSFGVIFRRRIASSLACIAYAAAALVLIGGSLVRVPFPWLLINISLGLLLSTPSILLFKYRRATVGW